MKTRDDWIRTVRGELLKRGWTGDSACEMAHGLADLFYSDLTPHQALDRAEHCARPVKITPAF